MASTQRRDVIFVIWIVMCAVVLREIVVWPAPDSDEHLKWVLVSAIFSGVPWLVNLLIILLIALSLERRLGRVRLWILAIWLFALVCPELIAYVRGGLIVNPVWQNALRASLGAFAFPWLFAFLLILWLAIWLEARMNKRSIPESEASL